jgi:prepilin-type processing-associated H-X9-DG protein
LIFYCWLAYAYIAYGYNYLYIGGSYGAGGERRIPAKENQLKHVGDTAMIADCWNNLYDGQSIRATSLINNTGTGTHVIHNRHSQGANILWCDGHASNMKQAMQQIQLDPLNKYMER